MFTESGSLVNPRFDNRAIRSHPDFERHVAASAEKRSSLEHPPEFDDACWRQLVEESACLRALTLLDERLKSGDADGALALVGRFEGYQEPYLPSSWRDKAEGLTILRWRRARLDGSGVRYAAEVRAQLITGCLRDTPAIEKARSWAAEAQDGSVLCLLGGTGVGKTVAAAAVICDRGGKAVRSGDLAFLAGSNYSADRDKFAELAGTEGLLVVDDVGTERDEDKARHALFDLVDIRQGPKMRTLMTTNLTAAEFKARFCERTISRLKAVGAMFSCAGEDLRGG